MKGIAQKLHIIRGEHIIDLEASIDVDSFSFKHVIPLKYGQQVPIFFDVDGDFISYKIMEDRGDYNKVIIFNMPPLKKGKRLNLKFNYWVLVRKINYKTIPKKVKITPQDQLPKTLKKWLVPTQSVQSKNIFIKIASRIIQGFSKDLLWFSKKIIFWCPYQNLLVNFLKRFMARYPITRKIFYSDNFWIPLEDALSCLFFGSTCAGRANLVVALLRAGGIPARILIVTPTLYGEKYWLDAQHYVEEFYCSDFGWIRTQPGMLLDLGKNHVVLKIVNPEDEDAAGNGFSEYGGMAPWFWITNKNVKFKLPDKFDSYNVKEEEKVGFPIIRGWKECIIKVPDELAEKTFEISRGTWDLFTKHAGIYKDDKHNIFNKAHSIQKQAVDYLVKSQIEKYINKMQEARDEYLKISKF